MATPAVHSRRIEAPANTLMCGATVALLSGAWRCLVAKTGKDAYSRDSDIRSIGL
jgi:hypothetical protein